MIWLYVLGGIMLLLAVLMIIPVRALVSFEDELFVTLKYLFFSFDLLPMKAEEEKPEPQTEVYKPKGKKKKDKKPLKSKDVFGYINLAKDIMPEVKNLIGFITGHIIIDKLNLKIVVSGDDAAETGILFGRLGAAVYSALAVAQNIFKVKPPNKINLVPDFVNYTNSISLKVRVSLQPWAALYAATLYGIRGFKKYLNFNHTQPKEAS